MPQGPVRRRSPARSVMKALASLGLGAAFVLPIAHAAGADPADYMLDLGAPAPSSYNHATGGGAWSDTGTIGRESRRGGALLRPGLVESLDGNAFQCGDTITFLELIERTSDLGGHAVETIELEYRFSTSPGALSGAAIRDVTDVSINYGAIDRFPWGLEARDGGASTDRAIFDDGGSTARLVGQVLSRTSNSTSTGEVLVATVQVDDLEINESVVLQINVVIECSEGSARPNTLFVDRSDRISVVADDGATTQIASSGAERIAFANADRIR